MGPVKGGSTLAHEGTNNAHNEGINAIYKCHIQMPYTYTGSSLEELSRQGLNK